MRLAAFFIISIYLSVAESCPSFPPRTVTSEEFLSSTPRTAFSYSLWAALGEESSNSLRSWMRHFRLLQTILPKFALSER